MVLALNAYKRLLMLLIVTTLSDETFLEIEFRIWLNV